jgi:hypothetical protein
MEGDARSRLADHALFIEKVMEEGRGLRRSDRLTERRLGCKKEEGRQQHMTHRSFGLQNCAFN